MVLLKQLLIFLFMMILGYGMAKKGIMEEKACSAINWLLVIPLAAMPVIRLVTSNVTVQAVCFVMLATPSGTMVSMMAQECGGEYMTENI